MKERVTIKCVLDIFFFLKKKRKSRYPSAIQDLIIERFRGLSQSTDVDAFKSTTRPEREKEGAKDIRRYSRI